MALTPSLSPAGLAAGAPCAACTPPAGPAPGGPFATALSAALQAGGGKPTAHTGLPLGVVAESGPALATLATGQDEAAGLPDEATAAAGAEGEPGEGDPPAWAAVLLAGVLPQAAPAAVADGTTGGPASTATRHPAATLAGVAAAWGTASGVSASEDGPATLAAGRQILPASAADPEAVMDLAAGEGRARLPAGSAFAGPLPAVGDSPPRDPGVADPLVAAHYDRAQETGRPAFAREPLALPLPLRAGGWDAELAQRVVWMAGRQAQWAEIAVNPPNLGSIEVHLSLRGNDASAYFYSPHAAVREAIDESLGRLRDMLAAAGIQLGQAQVGRESLTERQTGGFLPTTGTTAAAGTRVDEGPVYVRRGLVDLYI